MKIIECRGNNRRIGQTMGEALRSEIRQHIDEFCPAMDDRIRRELTYFKNSIHHTMPQIMEQLKGMAQGADVDEIKILVLNLPSFSADPCLEQGCTNIVFADGPDGPLWGKNNEGLSPTFQGRRPVAVLKLYPDDGIPAICFSICGWITGGDMINAEGVAVGHSSVGSKLQQSPHHVPVLPCLYVGMHKARTTQEFIRHVSSVPLRGKGFSMVVVDRQGTMASPELPCPLSQIRWPKEDELGMNCVNYYQFPTIKDLTNRTPAQLENCEQRRRFLEKETSQGDRSLAHIKQILRHHGQPDICRHGRNGDDAYTEYSMIGIPRNGNALFIDGYPCEHEYTTVTI